MTVEEGIEETVEESRENGKGVEAFVEGTVEEEVEARESRGVVDRVVVVRFLSSGISERD